MAARWTASVARRRPTDRDSDHIGLGYEFALDKQTDLYAVLMNDKFTGATTGNTLAAYDGTLLVYGAYAEVDVTQTLLPLLSGDEADVSYAIRPTYWDGVDLVPSASPL